MVITYGDNDTMLLTFLVLVPLAGLALIAWGAMHLGTSWGLAVLLFGLLPLATGAIDWCVLSALIGGPLTGRRLRGKP